MKKILVLWSVLLTPLGAIASNLAVLDSSGDQAHIASISGRILTKRCFSEADDRSIEYGNIGSDPEVSYYWRYRSASACPNGENSASYIGDRDVVEYHRVNGTDKIRTLSSNHLSHVIHSAQQYSNQKFLALSVSRYGSVGDIFVSPASLKNAVSRQGIIDGLNFVLANHLQYKIRVVNLSLGTSFHEGNGNCDSATLTNQENVIRNKIIELSNKGIVVVAAAGNSLPSGVDSGMMFPACLSYVVSVGGVTTYENKYYFAGTTSASIDFLDEYYYDSSYNNNSISGTSIASPKVAGLISEMMAINPGLSRAEILQKLLDTANRVGPVYYPNDPDKTDTQRLIPNPLAAIDAVNDPFWKEIIDLIKDVINSVKIGWNYGSDEHSNGALIVFPQMTLPQAKLVDNQPVARFSLNAYDIDTADEVEVLINDKPYGFLDVTGSNVTGGTQVFCIPQSDLVSVGSNEVKLRLKNSQETWGVTNFKVETGVYDGNCKTATSDDPNNPDDPENPPGTGQNESVSLSINTLNTKEYGLNYGRNRSTDELDVRFFATGSSDFKVSWVAFDIEADEMSVYLNDTLIRTIPVTGADQLGFTDHIVITPEERNNGSNTLSFRVTGGNTKWGITNLIYRSVSPVPIDQTVNETLMEANGEYGQYFGSTESSFDFPFNFTPRGPYYDETVTIKFDGHIRSSTYSSFEILLNGESIKKFVSRYGSSYPKAYQHVVDKSSLETGVNTITLRSIVQNSIDELDSGFSNVRVITKSIPMLDVETRNISVQEKLVFNRPFVASVIVSNPSPKTSLDKTLTFYVSDHGDKTAPIWVSDTIIGSFAGETLRIEDHVIQSREVKDGRYLRACIDHEANDIAAENNCSSAVKLDVQSIVVAPILMFLLEDIDD